MHEKTVLTVIVNSLSDMMYFTVGVLVRKKCDMYAYSYICMYLFACLGGAVKVKGHGRRNVSFKPYYS